MTDHRTEIEALRGLADNMAVGSDPSHTDELLKVLTLRVAADLLEIHDATGISLDNWPAARQLVEVLIGHEIQENHA